MNVLLSIFSLTCSFFYASAIQHPTGFTTHEECVKNGATVTYLHEEKSGIKQFVLSLDNAVVIGEGGIVTNDGKIVTDTETYKQDQQRLLRGNRDISKEDSMFFEGTLAVMSSPGQQCYYHWLLQTLPRLKLLADSKLSYDKIYIYGDNFKYGWQKDSLYTALDYLGISHDKLLFVEHDIIVEAKKLLVPSVPWMPSKRSEFERAELDWHKKFLKNVFVTQSNKNTPKHIFISRSKARYRRITNEDALLESLHKKGFVAYCLEDLSICDQVTLFNNAQVIIGPHGAGWSNLIFCNPGTKIIEIDHGVAGNEPRSPFERMAKRMVCLYHPFYTDLLEPDVLENNPNQDITVDIEAFTLFLQGLEI